MIILSSALSAESPAVRGPLGLLERSHTRRNASPMFLLGAPSLSLTALCTNEDMRLTNTMTSCWRHSVQSVKLRMSQKPKMPVMRLPGITGLMWSLSESAIFCWIMEAPASPNPTCSIALSLRIAWATRRVSLSMFCSSSTSSCIVPKGSCARLRTRRAMVSSGEMTSLSLSRLKSADEMARTIVTHDTVRIFTRASERASPTVALRTTFRPL
mmetsp:Transcript_6077/g.13838  ORF Transcript_6077/g.13838 Transcript_6077/m.13838 type:complete len:213 (+) Transcript_6077:1247-1885(+)